MSPESKVLTRAMKATGVTLGALALVSGAIAWGVEGAESAGAAVAGVMVAAFVGLSTQAALFMALRLSPTALMGILLGSYGIKVAVLLLVLVTVGESDLPRGAFAIPLVIGAVATLAIDVVVVVRSRVPNVAPGRGNEAG